MGDGDAHPKRTLPLAHTQTHPSRIQHLLPHFPVGRLDHRHHLGDQRFVPADDVGLAGRVELVLWKVRVCETKTEDMLECLGADRKDG